MKLTDERIKDIADQFGGSGAQKAAIIKALDSIAAEFAQDTIVGHPQPRAKTALFVCSGNTVSQPVMRTVWPMLDAALARFGEVEVVTFGNMGAETVAQRWARTRQQPSREYAVAWSIVHPDGTTARDSKAVGTRNAKLLSFVEDVQTPIAVLYGDPTDPSGKRAQTTFALLTGKGGAYHQGRPVPTDEQLLAEVGADQPEVAPAQPESPESSTKLADALAGFDAAVHEADSPEQA